MSLRTFFLLLGVGWLILVLQSTVVSYTTYSILQPDMLLIILVYAGIRRGKVNGAGLALSYGYLVDLFSGRPFGTYLFLYVCLFFLVRLLGMRLLLQTRAVQMLLVAMLSVLIEAGAAGLGRLASIPSPLEFTPASVVARAASSAAVVLLLFPLLSRVESSLARRTGTIQVSA